MDGRPLLLYFLSILFDGDLLCESVVVEIFHHGCECLMVFDQTLFDDLNVKIRRF